MKKNYISIAHTVFCLLFLSVFSLSFASCGLFGNDDDDEEDNVKGTPWIVIQVNRVKGTGDRTYKVEAEVLNLEASEITNIGCLVRNGNSLVGSGVLSTGYSTKGSANITLTSTLTGSGTITFEVHATTVSGQVIKNSIPIRY